MEHFEKVRDFVIKCKYCGKEISNGLLNIINHQTECSDFPNSKWDGKSLTLKDVEVIFDKLYHNRY